MIRVVVIDRAGRQRAHHFKKREITIGRGESNDLVLDDATVSKHHARIVAKQARHVVFDLHSESGVFINKRRIGSPEVVAAEDEVGIGSFSLRVSMREGTAPRNVESGRTVCPRCGGPLGFRNLADYCAACDVAFA